MIIRLVSSLQFVTNHRNVPFLSWHCERTVVHSQCQDKKGFGCFAITMITATCFNFFQKFILCCQNLFTSFMIFGQYPAIVCLVVYFCNRFTFIILHYQVKASFPSSPVSAVFCFLFSKNCPRNLQKRQVNWFKRGAWAEFSLFHIF